MGQLRTANKRHKRAIVASQARDKAASDTPATPVQPATETVRS